MRTTLRALMKRYPKEKCFATPRISLVDLSYEDKIELMNNNQYNNTHVYFNINDERIYYATFIDMVKRRGNKFFVNSTVNNSIYISPTEVRVKCDPQRKRDFLKLFGITWFEELPNAIISRFFTGSILKSILIGTIYNQETFYKAVGKRIFQSKVSWRLLKEYFEKDRAYFNITDLYYFTKNIDDSLREIIKQMDSNYNGDRVNLLWDVLQCAVKLNEIVDFNWSDRRLKEEHDRQNKELTERNMAHKSVEPIFDLDQFEDFSGFKGAELLNTERDIYLEGANMHHCLYNCYYNRIKDHDYIAFHMKYPEECTFSFRLGEHERSGQPTVILDQIFKKYDEHVLLSTKEIAEDFKKKYYYELKYLLTHVKEKEDDWPVFQF